MNNLSSKQQSFIKLMKDGDEYERRGFELLLKRSDFEAFFEALANAELFDPSRNPGPVAGDKPGYYRIPYWPPLAYLEAAAKLAGERADLALAGKVMGVIRDVSQWRDKDGNVRDNHNTWSAFAKMLGLLPTSAVSVADIDLIPAWLTGQFDRSMIGHALASGTLRKFLASENPGDWAKACRILYHCTAIEFTDEALGAEKTTTEARTVVDDYWLKDLINASAAAFGRKAGKDAADIFLIRLRDVFARAMGGHYTWLYRPAIEDHPQNYDWRGPYNRFVEGLRITLLAWLESDAQKARPYIEGLFGSGSEIVERIAIHIVDQRFEALRASVLRVISPGFFASAHRHELYLFLKNHFQHFNEDEKAATLAAIRELPMPDRGADSERILRGIQQKWLSAITGLGDPAADKWFGELTDAPGSPGLSPHPDFNSYHESRWGFGPTPHNVQDLVAFAQGGTIVDQLNSFTPSNSWDGPTKRSLADAVIDAVGAEPLTFVEQLLPFLSAKPEYQYAIIAGFKKLWEAWDGKQPGIDWKEIWPKLIGFFEALLNDDNLWKGEVNEERSLSPTRDWIPPVISEFLRAGTRSDDKAYAPDLLPRTLALVVILLNKSEPQKEPSEGDALTRAINTSKGKAVEALLDHALRCCRLSDQSKKNHADAWQELQPIFGAELEECRNGNFEFSALAGAYIGNLHYMSAAWVHANFKKIFPIEFPANCLSALDGLAFAPPMKPIYEDLVGSAVLEWALCHEMKGKHARENLVQRMGLAYLWDQEKLEGPRFSYLFEARRIADLEHVTNYFWMIRGEPLSDEQKERVFLFWDRCVTWGKTLETLPASLLSTLSLLSCYLMAIDKRALEWLLAIAPHVSINYNADRLIVELARLADNNPDNVGQVLCVLLEGYQPVYDLDDRLKKLIMQLAVRTESRSNAIRCVERVRHLPGMVQLYAQLSSTPAPAVE